VSRDLTVWESSHDVSKVFNAVVFGITLCPPKRQGTASQSRQLSAFTLRGAQHP